MAKLLALILKLRILLKVRILRLRCPISLESPEFIIIVFMVIPIEFKNVFDVNDLQRNIPINEVVVIIRIMIVKTIIFLF